MSEDVTIIDVEECLIVGNRQKLKKIILDELDKGKRKFVVDFSESLYVDSSGLGALLSISKKIHEQGGELMLVSLNGDLRALFELTKLDTLFNIVENREEALKDI